ncbi:MAG: fatty acid desaturase [Granulosicoccus sp.]
MSLPAAIQWRTILLFAIVYAAWFLLTLACVHYSAWFALPLILVLTLHSSLQHEVIHGHPTQWQVVNGALAAPAPGLFIPFERFEYLHLQHHRDWLLTDPYDDTESYFLSSSQWQSLAPLSRFILTLNNTLLGRLIIGPGIMYSRFFYSEITLLRSRSPGVLEAWCKHFPGVIPVLLWLYWIDFSLLFYVFAAVWPSTSLLLLRAFTEHLPAKSVHERSAIVRSGKLMGLLFLNNNLHRVHHDNPELPWYELPALYNRNYANSDGDHHIPGYLHLLRRYAVKPRFTVAHPILRVEPNRRT